MAGIGIRLNRIFEKRTIGAHLIGFGYSAMTIIAPMFLVIGSIMLMQLLLGYSTVGYFKRELFACTVLYIFIFSLLSVSPFNAVLSRYLSDVIYNEAYEDILPCFYTGLIVNLALSSLIGVPFCVHELIVGKVPFHYVLTGYLGYISLVMVFYSMLYLSICKDYGKISRYFLYGALLAVVLALVLVYLCHWEITYSMLFSLSVGFMVTAALEMAIVRTYFRENSRNYRPVFRYFKKYWKLIAANFLYTLGLYIHNFVFWTTDMRMVLVDSFVCCQPYDMASCLAMFTNISASVIFIARTEMQFRERYKAYSEAVIGGRGIDIQVSKQRMFRSLAEELMNLLRIQFIITVVIFLLCEIFLPRFGFGGLVMQIYPALAAGYFILYLMYSSILYLYYFEDLTGAALTGLIFCAITMFGAILGTRLPELFYGIGPIAGALCGWTFAYFRLRWVEKNLDVHIFCNGKLLRAGSNKMPPSKVFDRYPTPPKKRFARR